MISLRSSQITDSLPAILRAQPWVQAVSYAVACAFGRMLDAADRSLTYAAVDTLDHPVLDALAVDLYVRHYDRTFDLQTKRQLVKFALQYWSTAGSVAATEKVAQILFGAARITEWYEYGGNAGCFKISIEDTRLTDADVVRFKAAAEQNKRLSAHLDTVLLELPDQRHPVYAGMQYVEAQTDTIRHKRDENLFVGNLLLEIGNDTYRMEA